MNLLQNNKKKKIETNIVTNEIVDIQLGNDA